MNMQTNKNIFIISGPAGVGKDTILNGILKQFPNFVRLSTYTTRAPRIDEGIKKGRIFISNDEFETMIAKNEFIEYEKVHAWYYGAKKSDIDNILHAGKAIIFDTDVKGGLKYKKLYPNNLVLIFIKFEHSIDELRDRIKNNRPDATKQEIELRFQTAANEMTYENKYDYVIVNPEGHPEKAISEVTKIINQSINLSK